VSIFPEEIEEPIAWERLERYLAGRANPTECVSVRRYIALHPQLAAEIDRLRTEMGGPFDDEPSRGATLVSLNIARKKLGLSAVDIESRDAADVESREIDQVVQTVSHSRNLRWVRESGWTLSRSMPQMLWHRSTRRRFIGAAIVAVGVLSSSIVFWRHTHVSTAGAAFQGTVYTTHPGQRADITLSDGTHVVLNVASRIEIPKRFGEHGRIVKLQGEAAFHVTRTDGVPFIVDAGGTQTRVLGTEFSVRSYEPHDVRVAVRTGKVAFDTAVLGANDVAQTGATGRITVSRNQNVDAAFAFTEGRLIVVSYALRNVLGELDRWYDVDIRLGDSAIGNMPIHAELMSGSIGDLSGFLKKLYDVRVVRDGRTLTLYQR
jgi:ferric-dicitrate binding protein FerR (iron transport regulator)